MKKIAYISTYILYLAILFSFGYIVDSNSWNGLIFLAGTMLICLNIRCVLAEYKRMTIKNIVSKDKMLFKKAMVKYFLMVSISSICPMVLIGINLFLHEKRFPTINYLGVMAIFSVLEACYLYIDPLVPKKYLELSDLTEEEIVIIRRAIESRNYGRMYKRTPKSDGIKIFESWATILLIILIFLFNKKYLPGKFIYSTILMSVILLISILVIELHYSPKAFPKKEKPVSNDYEDDVIKILQKYRGKGIHINTRYIN